MGSTFLWQRRRAVTIIRAMLDRFEPAGRGAADPPAVPVMAQHAEAFEILAGDAGSGLVFLCDHATAIVPPDYGDLGLPAAEFRRHIAFDIGAEAVTRGLAARFGAPAVLSRFSRLVIDPNRGTDDPTLLMRLSDGAVVPGNARADAEERTRRIARFWTPYDEAIGRTVRAALGSGRVPSIVSIHSFTPVWKGVPRPWHAGILWDADPRLARPLVDALGADGTMAVGDNEPYDGALAGDVLYRHATRRGLPNALIELRQDLVAEADGVAAWVARIAAALAAIRFAPDLAERRWFGSRSGPVTPRDD
ncbi:putative N-formylglutamate amidohydrolase [Prosthecomicrobium pneumaticum]|uniref:Putative N-formylglutamate amidohydrolase n=2 Tax=Prosthecomicrobium pneumaticum TaxID=81895 RepID=A0A7W9CVB6_9HYPH|nr:putative N-formylglutamate amidohydrolase [Prosthecomicrobium pneumaticum]